MLKGEFISINFGFRAFCNLEKLFKKCPGLVSYFDQPLMLAELSQRHKINFRLQRFRIFVWHSSVKSGFLIFFPPDLFIYLFLNQVKFHSFRHRVRQAAEQQHLHHCKAQRGGSGHALPVPQTHQRNLDTGRAAHSARQPQLHGTVSHLHWI